MAKGKALEYLVQLVRETLKDHPDTKVLHNQKLSTPRGRKRQFDVLVETTVNGFFLRIAIECKQHVRPIEAKEIEAFRSKCELVGKIDKLVFVSNSGFDPGAVESAERFGIELHILSEVKKEKIETWMKPEESFGLRFFKRFINISLEVEGTEQEVSNLKLSVETPVYVISGKQLSLHKFADFIIFQSGFYKFIRSEQIRKVVENTDLSISQSIERAQFKADLGRFSYIQMGERTLFIKSVEVQMDVWSQKEKYETETRIMLSIGEMKLKAEIITFNNIGKNGEKMQMIVNSESGSYKSYITTSEGKKMNELDTLGKFDPKTGAWEEF